MSSTQPAFSDATRAAAIVLLIVVLIVGGWLVVSPLLDRRKAQDAAENIVRSSLAAPEYATFEDVRVRHDDVVCGTVTGRLLGESFVHRQRFLTTGTLVHFEWAGYNEAFKLLWKEHCTS